MSIVHFYIPFIFLIYICFHAKLKSISFTQLYITRTHIFPSVLIHLFICVFIHQMLLLFISFSISFFYSYYFSCAQMHIGRVKGKRSLKTTLMRSTTATATHSNRRKKQQTHTRMALIDHNNNKQ